MSQKIIRWMLALLLLGAGLAMAQQEPSVNQIYAAAEAGKISEAQTMVQQVLVAHPNSAKAHFVQSELFARQGNLSRARESLANAERLAPGLPFAKAEAVTALRSQLNPPSNARPIAMTAQTAPQQHNTWIVPLLLAGGVILVAYFVFRPKRPTTVVMDGNGLQGPQAFGSNGYNGGGAVMQPTYGPSPYGPGAYGGQPGYGQAPGSGLGGRIMGGVATGLAVGAGVVAAEAIGRSLMGDHERPSHIEGGYNDGNYEPINPNPNMGGQDFGINDTSSWDDAGSGGGGDWDN